MIQQNNSSKQTKIQLLQAFKALGIARILRNSGIRKAKGTSAFEVFKFLFLLVFQGKNLYRYLDSNRSDKACSKNTYYRFLNESTFNWRRFLLTLSTKVISSISKLTRASRVRVLVLDDSVVARNRSKSVELLARGYDHASHKYYKGFTMLSLGWSDGYSFIPVDFAMLSSANEKNRYCEIDSSIDKRTSGYKRRIESMMKKTDAAVNLVKNALSTGIQANYVLMDTWFTSEPMIKSMLHEGIDVIGMVKDINQKYHYNGELYTLKELKKTLSKVENKSILGSLVTKTKKGIPVKVVFVTNRTNGSKWLAILSTDITLTDDEIVRIYGKRSSKMPISAFLTSAYHKFE